MKDMTHIQWLTDLHLMSQQAGGADDRQHAVDAMLAHIVGGFDGVTGCLAVRDREGDGLVIVSAIDLPVGVVGRHVKRGDGVLGSVLASAQPLLLNGDLRTAERANTADPPTHRRPRSALCWPLAIESEVVGVLSINRDDAADPFTQADLDRGRPVVALLALVVDNWQMHVDQQDRLERLSRANAEIQAVNRRLAEAQNQLLQSEKMASIGQLAAGVAHEINNPIGYVSSNLQTLAGYARELTSLLDRLQATPELKPVVDASGVDVDFLREDMGALIAESHEGLDRVKKIVQDLRDFSRVDQSDEWQAADLVACLESTLNIVNNEIKYKAVVDKRLVPLPDVTCLASQVNQVFMNLLVNAAQAVDRDGRITLGCGHDDGADEVWFEVADNGCGIPPDNLGRIFEPFFTTKPVGKGTGLGLSLSYSIVQKHHGRLEVDSQVGRGTRFRVVLPVSRCEEAVA